MIITIKQNTIYYYNIVDLEPSYGLAPDLRILRNIIIRKLLGHMNFIGHNNYISKMELNVT